jgi:hypothetical protein
METAQAQQGAALVNAQMAANLQANAYNTGVATSTQQQEAGVNQAQAALSAGQSGALASTGLGSQANQSQVASQLSAANSGIAANLGNANLQLGANSQLGSATAEGVNAANSAQNQAASNYALGAAGSGVAQTNAQNQLNANYQQFQNTNAYNQGILNNYWNIASSKLGTSGTSDQSTQAPFNPMTAAAGGLQTAVGGITNAYNAYNQNQPTNYQTAPAAGNTSPIGTLVGGV